MVQLKYNRQMLMPVEEDMDARMIFKENYEHDYLYVGRIDGSRRRVRQAVAKM